MKIIYEKTNVLQIIEINGEIEELEGIVAPSGIVIQGPLGSGVIVTR